MNNGANRVPGGPAANAPSVATNAKGGHCLACTAATLLSRLTRNGAGPGFGSADASQRHLRIVLFPGDERDCSVKYAGGRARMLEAMLRSNLLLTVGLRAPTTATAHRPGVGVLACVVRGDSVVEGGLAAVHRSAGADALQVIAVGDVRPQQRHACMREFGALLVVGQLRGGEGVKRHQQVQGGGHSRPEGPAGLDRGVRRS